MKKAQISPITIIFWTSIFLIIYFLALAKQISYWGHQAVINGNITGIEALLYDNINLSITMTVIIFVLAVGVIGLRGDQ